MQAVTAPVLIVVGDFEDEESKASAQALAGELGDARVAEIAAAGRRAVLEQPGEVASVIAGFIKELGA